MTKLVNVEDANVQSVGDYLFQNSERAVIGEGTFGLVYLGHEKRSGLPVAIKRLRIESVKKEELEIVSSIDSDFVVRLISLLENADFYYIVMELCDCTLEQHLLNRTEKRMGLPNLDVVLISLANGYYELFKRNIIHRDIKPQNILLRYHNNNDRNGFVDSAIAVAKISDFGSSRLAENNISDANLAGTPLYMAPEIGANILSETDYNSKVDMWSIGIVLFECLVGKVPFDERSLCRLFLFASNRNYDGYKCPELPPAPDRYKYIIPRLLQIDSKKRLDPPGFHLNVTKGIKKGIKNCSSGLRKRIRRNGKLDLLLEIMRNVLLFVASNYSSFSLAQAELGNCSFN